MKLSKIINILELLFPKNLAEKWDNSGLQIGDQNSEINKILLALDVNDSVVNIAVEKKYDLILTHHPFIFNPLKSINIGDKKGKIIKELIKNNINLYTMHTNLDVCSNGVNLALAQKLEIIDYKLLSINNEKNLYKLYLYVPIDHAEFMRQKLFEVKAGQIGDYDYCSFNFNGMATFYPREESDPYIGYKNEINYVDETKIEIIVEGAKINKIKEIIYKYHPYEEPAFDIIKLENIKEIYGYGGIGNITECNLLDYAKKVKENLKCSNVKLYCNDINKNVQRIAFCGGSGSSFIDNAIRKKADVFITGDLKYHDIQHALDYNLAIIDAGHYNTEAPVLKLLKDYIVEQNKDLKVDILEKNDIEEFVI